MKDVIKFLLFLFYAAAIFFIPNNNMILFAFGINLVTMLLVKVKIKETIKNLFKFLPFILFTAIINCLLDDYQNAIWIGIKLLLVCNITFLYSKTTTTGKIAKTIATLCTPLKYFKVNLKEIEILVSISLAMLPILKREYLEVKEACKAKNIQFNITNMKMILSKLFISLFRRVNEIDEALLEKGYDL